MTYIEALKKQAEKDAKRYLEAKLNYGTGAGTQRKLLDAELKEKLKDEIYKTAFEKALAAASEADALKKVRQKKGVQRAVEGGRKTLRAARRAENFWYRNQQWLGPLVKAIFG